jgi:zinc protease
MTSTMDEGTGKFNGIQLRQFKKLNGIKLNISTQKNKIEGSFQVISSQVEQGFELLDQVLNFPKFDKSDLEKVLKQMEASLKIDQSDLSTLSNNKFNDIFFKNNNFSKRIKGTQKTLNNITKDDLIKHHKNSFNKKELHIGVSGDISEKSIKKYIEKVFGKFSIENVKPNFEKFIDLPRGQKVIELDTPQSSVVFGHPGLSRSDKDYFSLRLANYILGGGGFQSRLYKQIREKKGLVYSIYSYPISYKHDGFMMGGFQTRNKSVFDTIDRVKDEWSKISKQGITKKELDEAKAYYKGSFTRNFTSTISIANLLNIVQFYDLGKDYFSERDKIIENLKLEDINNMIKKKFNKDNLFFLIVGSPEKQR